VRKRVLAGIAITVVLLLFIIVGKIIHLPSGVSLPGPQPSQIWSRDTSTNNYLAEDEGKLVLVEEEGGDFIARGIDFYGKSIWEEKGKGATQFFFDEKYWAYTESPGGHVKVFDYQGSQAGQLTYDEEFNNIWLGPEGEIISVKNYTAGEDTLEGFYRESVEVNSLNDKKVYQDIFSGKGILDVRLLPGKDIIIINKVDIYPQVNARVAFYDLEGNKITEQNGSELFLSPLIVNEGETVVIGTGKELLLYSLKDNELLRWEWDYYIDDYFLISDGDIVLASGSREGLKENTQLLCVNSAGEILWERNLPGSYHQGKGRQDGGIFIESSTFLYLLQPDGTSCGYYSPQEEKDIYLLSSDVFLTIKDTEIKAYQWPLDKH